MPLLVCGAASEVHLGVSVIATPYAKWGRAGRTTAAPHLCMSRVPAIEMDGSQKEFNKDLLPGTGWDPKGAQRILGSGNFQGLCFLFVMLWRPLSLLDRRRGPTWNLIRRVSRGAHLGTSISSVLRGFRNC